MNSRFPIFYSDFFEAHNTGPSHPENAGRLSAVVAHLRNCQKADSKEAFWADKISWMKPSDRAVLSHIHRVHDSAYVSALKAFSSRGGGHLDGDTVVSAESYDVALCAITAWLDGIDWVCQHQSPAFALVRPPGHHAERAMGMGFCLLSNAAIAAHYALACLPVKRVAILDWDVHHGNGTQALVSEYPNLAYCSFHQSPAYPGTGAPSETGAHQNVLNLPLPPGAQVADYQALWMNRAQPFLADFDADLMIVSAGYDANQADPLAGIALQPEDYGWFTGACLQLNTPVLFGLEGGYDYRSLSQSVAATIKACIHNFFELKI